VCTIAHPIFQPVTLNVFPALLRTTVLSHMPGSVAMLTCFLPSPNTCVSEKEGHLCALVCVFVCVVCVLSVCAYCVLSECA